jgi:hypothetical protein
MKSLRRFASSDARCVAAKGNHLSLIAVAMIVMLLVCVAAAADPAGEGDENLFGRLSYAASARNPGGTSDPY